MAEPIPKPDDLAAVRMARNESIFRETNERTEQKAEAEGREQLVAFLCECARPDCAEVVRLDLTEYEAVRSRPKQFVTAPGHALVAPASRMSCAKLTGTRSLRRTASRETSRPGPIRATVSFAARRRMWRRVRPPAPARVTPTRSCGEMSRTLRSLRGRRRV
jgi:hypothetical protein